MVLVPPLPATDDQKVGRSLAEIAGPEVQPGRASAYVVEMAEGYGAVPATDEGNRARDWDRDGCAQTAEIAIAVADVRLGRNEPAVSPKTPLLQFV